MTHVSRASKHVASANLRFVCQLILTDDVTGVKEFTKLDKTRLFAKGVFSISQNFKDSRQDAERPTSTDVVKWL